MTLNLAREFSSSEISKVAPVNHGYPPYDPYERLMARKFVDWRLYVDGMVERPMSFSLADLKQLPSRTQITELNCEEGWCYIAAWTGVQLSLILYLVGAKPDAKESNILTKELYGFFTKPSNTGQAPIERAFSSSSASKPARSPRTHSRLI